MTAAMVESALDPTIAVLSEVVPAGEPWMGIVRKGQFFRILDLEGNQAVDTLFYNATDHEERYSASDTIRAQGNIYLTTGAKRSDRAWEDERRQARGSRSIDAYTLLRITEVATGLTLLELPLGATATGLPQFSADRSRLAVATDRGIAESDDRLAPIHAVAWCGRNG